MLDLFDYKQLPDTLHIKVTPSAKSEQIKKEVSVNGSVLYKIYVKAPPENGKANDAVVKLIAKLLGITKTSVIITHGLTSNRKVIKIKYE